MTNYIKMEDIYQIEHHGEYVRCGRLEEVGMTELKDASWLWRLLGGLVLIALGVLVIAYPGVTVEVVVVLFGILMLISGLFQAIFGLSVRSASKIRLLFILVGAISILLGLLAIITPFSVVLVGWILIALWAILWGAFEIVAVLLSPADKGPMVYGGGGKWIALLVGLLAIALGAVFIAFPGESILAVVWMGGGLVILLGLAVAISAFQLRKSTY